MEHTIHLVDALRLMDEKSQPDGTPITHSLAFIKHSARGDGKGEIVRMDNIVQCGLKFGRVDKMMRAVKSSVTGHIRQFHIRLMFEFNGLKVVWS